MEQKKRFALAVTLATACAVPSKQEPMPRAVERVANRDSCLDIAYCAAFSPFRRLTDFQLGYVAWLISDQGHGCMVSDADFVRVPDGALVECNWRLQRP